MSAKHDDDALLCFCGRDYCIDYETEIARDKNIRQRFDECVEAAVLPWERCELFGGNLVRSAANGDGLYTRQVSLGVRRGAAGTYRVAGGM
jgi:hypothetical protein